ncbi:MAG: M4 family metallopeptidase [Anaerolineales bacterium]|nr:M4 family metallopeptidase [Anaerolineales bacterium]
MQSALAVTARENGVSVDALQASTPELWIYNPALLTPYAGQTVLGWRMEVTPRTELLPVRQLVLVEAKRGGIALSFNQIDYAKNRLTYDTGGTNILPGTLVCNESNPTCTGGSADAINAHVFAGQTYDAYVNNHGRDSIDGAGMALISTVNYDDVSGGPTYQTLLEWRAMVYGAGFSSADDVVAHELTHGVTQYESNLFYYYQSGAINESFSDVWGEFVDLSNGMGTDTAATRWQMGEDLTAFGVIRDMEDPTLYGDPDKMTSVNYSFDTSYADNGGVHSNSGINNKAVFLMVDGGTFNGRTVTGLNIVKVAKFITTPKPTCRIQAQIIWICIMPCSLPALRSPVPPGSRPPIVRKCLTRSTRLR